VKRKESIFDWIQNPLGHMESIVGMFSSLLLMTLMSATPGQTTPAIALTNVRANYGELGSPRSDVKMLPGDILFLGFDIEGIKVDNDGKVLYTMEMEVVDSKGKAIFKQQPVEKNDFLPLGGNKLPARAFVSVGLNQAPGMYTCKVTVIDRASKATANLEKQFEVLKADFGLVTVYTSCDDRGTLPAPQTGIVGQSVWVHFATVGFGRGTTNKQPNIDVEMVVLDKDGKPTVPNPTKYSINKDVPEDHEGIPLRFLLPMNRAGDYTVELKATDGVTKKTSKVTLPFKVIAPGK
jgi:hypothetical protein